MLIAGLVGVFIQERATFSAEVGGCMAETGAGGGMAAAAITYMAGGTNDQVHTNLIVMSCPLLAFCTCMESRENAHIRTRTHIHRRLVQPRLQSKIPSGSRATQLAIVSKHLV